MRTRKWLLYPYNSHFQFCNTPLYPYNKPMQNCSISLYPYNEPMQNCNTSLYPYNEAMQNCNTSLYPYNDMFYPRERAEIRLKGLGCGCGWPMTLLIGGRGGCSLLRAACAAFCCPYGI